MASRLFTVDLDLGLNKAKRFTFEDFATNPDSDLSVGRIIYFTGSGGDQNHLRVYNGTAWKTVAYTDDTPDLTGVVFETTTQTLTNKTYEDAILKDRISFTNNSDVETMVIEHGGTGVTRLVTSDDLALKATNGDILLYPGDQAGGIGKVYVGWGNANPDTAYGIANPQNEVTTAGNTQNLTNKTIEDAILKDRISFTNNSDVETMYIEHSGTGTNRIVSDDDISIRSQNGDIILYPGNDSSWGGDGGTGRAYVHWGNDATAASPENEITTAGNTQIFTNKTVNDTLWFTNPSTIPNDGSLVINDTTEDFEIYGLTGHLVLGATGTGKSVVLSGNAGEFLNDPTDPDNQIATVGDISGFTATISANQFQAGLIDEGDTIYGGYTFHNDGGLDTGMFSPSDGEVKFYSNDILIAHFNTDAFTVDSNLIVSGDLTVNGTLTTLNTESVVIEDNILLLNSNFTEGIPSLNAGLEVGRGDYTNTSLYWNETANKWYVDVVDDDNSAATPTAISLAGHTHTHDDITDFSTAVEDQIDNYLSTIESSLVSDGFTKKYTLANPSITVSGGEATWTITHGLGADVIAQFREAATNKVVEADIQIAATTVVIKWNSAADITAGDYKVVVIG